MRSTQHPARISRLRKGEGPMLFSKICGMRCPECRTLQAASWLIKTNPWRGWNKTEAHECDGCGANFYLTGKRRNLRFILVGTPLFFASIFVGFTIMNHLEGLHDFHVARGHNEPNFLGFLIVCFLFVFPCQLALSRFEKSQCLATKRSVSEWQSAPLLHLTLNIPGWTHRRCVRGRAPLKNNRLIASPPSKGRSHDL